MLFANHIQRPRPSGVACCRTSYTGVCFMALLCRSEGHAHQGHLRALCACTATSLHTPTLCCRPLHAFGRSALAAAKPAAIGPRSHHHALAACATCMHGQRAECVSRTHQNLLWIPTCTCTTLYGRRAAWPAALVSFACHQQQAACCTSVALCPLHLEPVLWCTSTGRTYPCEAPAVQSTKPSCGMRVRGQKEA